MSSTASLVRTVAETVGKVNVLAQAYNVGGRASQRRGLAEHV